MEMLDEVISKVFVCLLSYDRKAGVGIQHITRGENVICPAHSKDCSWSHFG